jgi:hypothetical protein
VPSLVLLLVGAVMALLLSGAQALTVQRLRRSLRGEPGPHGEASWKSRLGEAWASSTEPDQASAALDAELAELEQALSARAPWPRVAWKVALASGFGALALALAQGRLGLLPLLAGGGATLVALGLLFSRVLARALEALRIEVDREVDRLLGSLRSGVSRQDTGVLSRRASPWRARRSRVRRSQG